MNDREFEQKQQCAIYSAIPSITEAIHGQNDGRNLECWPVLSFGWKDADLDAEGCTGIKSITMPETGYQSDNHLTVTVGGHKTFCYSNPEIEDEVEYLKKKEELNNAENEWLIDETSNYCGDSDQDGLTVEFSADIAVPVVFNDDVLNIPETAEAIIAAACTRCNEFSRDMARINAEYENFLQMMIGAIED